MNEHPPFVTERYLPPAGPRNDAQPRAGARTSERPSKRVKIIMGSDVKSKQSTGFGRTGWRGASCTCSLGVLAH